MRKKLTGILNIILAAVLIIGPRTFLHVCKGGMKMEADSAMGGMKMPCSDVPNASLIAGIILAIIGIVFIASGNKKIAGTVASILNIVLGVITVGIPTFLIGVCSAPHMHCHMVTRPALIILGAFVIVLGVINAAVELKGTSEKSEKIDAELSTN